MKLPWLKVTLGALLALMAVLESGHCGVFDRCIQWYSPVGLPLALMVASSLLILCLAARELFYLSLRQPLYSQPFSSIAVPPMGQWPSFPSPAFIVTEYEPEFPLGLDA
jgi:hypothetical protein